MLSQDLDTRTDARYARTTALPHTAPDRE